MTTSICPGCGAWHDEDRFCFLRGLMAYEQSKLAAVAGVRKKDAHETAVTVDGKRCSKCGVVYENVAAAFTRDAQKRDGLRSSCRACNSHRENSETWVRGPGKVEATCESCGKAFRTYKSRTRVARFCSPECFYSAVRGTRRQTATLTCAKCEKPFEVMSCQSKGVGKTRKRRFCSKACANIVWIPRPTLSCIVCGGPFQPKQPHHAKTRKCCSAACGYQYVKYFRRKVRNEAHSRLGRRDYLRARLRVLARDGHRCVQCGTDQKLTVHHLLRWTASRDDSDENLVTLCRPCHGATEPHWRMFASEWFGGREESA